jgi:large subunit ribosomal protein L4
LRSALSVKAFEKQIVVMQDLEIDAPKTREMATLLGNLGLSAKVLILLPESNDVVEKAARNLPAVTTLRASYLNIRDLLTHDHVVMPLESLHVVEGILG